MTTTLPATDRTQLDGVVQAAMERWVVPGLTLGVLRDGAVETFAYGVTSLEMNWPVTAETIFQAGSISKVFTTTLIMQLVDEGQLTLDTPVIQYLPSLRLADETATRNATLRQLLTHTAGFYGDRFDDQGHGDDALARSVASFDTLRQYTPPGEAWAYCNTGFQLAGRVIEVVLGTSFEAAMRQRILEPLGLTRSFYSAHEAITYPVATGHNTEPPRSGERPLQPAVAREWGRSRCRSAQGGLLTTVPDLLRFAAFHMGDGTAGGRHVLNQRRLRAMQEPLVEAVISPYWGIGWAVEEIDGVRLVGHGGVTNGFQARLTVVPDHHFAFACLTNGNLGGAAHREIGDWLLARCTGLRRTEPERVTLPAEALARLAGRYERPGMITTVSVVGDELQIETFGQNQMTKEPLTLPPRRAAAIGEARFRILDGEHEGAIFDFILDPDGSPRFLRHDGRLMDRVMRDA